MFQRSLAPTAAATTSVLISVIGFVSLGSQTQAQNVQSRFPVTSAIRDGGTLDWHSGRWKRAGGSLLNASSAFTIYDNTCTWAGGAFFAPINACEQAYDEGRIPTTDPNDPINSVTSLTSDSYNFCGFSFSYCSDETAVDLDFGFYQGLLSQGVGGSCGGPYTPAAAAVGLQISLVGLPSSTFQGFLTCWDVTIDLSNNANGGFAFDGNDDVTYTGVEDEDLFGWSWSPANLSTSVGTGLILKGEPANTSTGGENTFDIPPSVDLITGAPCGSGLDTTDDFWLNMDQNPSACGLPTGCYMFGGYPGNPFASFGLSMFATLTTTDGFSNYCTASVSSSGCTASMSGSPRAPVSGANDWSISASGVEGNCPGIFFTANTAAAEIPFQGGTLCILPPLKRGPMMFSGGTPDSCTGSFHQVINDGAVFPAGFDGGPGATTFVQAWHRDPKLLPTTSLSDAIEITWAP